MMKPAGIPIYELIFISLLWFLHTGVCIAKKNETECRKCYGVRINKN